MIQCVDCEYYRSGPDGTPQLSCNPFTNIKEPECLAKWHLVHLNLISQSHQATLDMYRQLAPLQERMFKHMERELDETDEADRWKHSDDEEEDEDRDDPFSL